MVARKGADQQYADFLGLLKSYQNDINAAGQASGQAPSPDYKYTGYGANLAQSVWDANPNLMADRNAIKAAMQPGQAGYNYDGGELPNYGYNPVNRDSWFADIADPLSVVAMPFGGLPGMFGGEAALGGVGGIANGLGALFGDPTLGSDVGGFFSGLNPFGSGGFSGALGSLGDDLSKFSDSSGLSQLWGGTAAPVGDLSNLADSVNNAAPDLGATAGATNPVDFASGGPSASYAAGAAAPGSAGVGGGTLAGFGSSPGDIGESSAIGSASGGAPIGGGGTLPWQVQGTEAISPALANADPSLIQPGGGGAVGVGAMPGAAAGTSFPWQQSGYINPPSGGGMSGLASMFNGAAGSMGNGLLKAGLGYLFNNNNASGEKAIQNASNQAQANFAPYMAAGTGAENTLADLYGNNGSAAQTGAMQNFQNTPGYQFSLNQGLNAINADAAAKGQTLSGNTMEGINNYAQGTAAQQYNNYINQLQNLASGGLSAAGGSGTAGLVGAGARAQIGQTNANNQNNALGAGLSALFPGGGFDWTKLIGNNSNANSGILSLF